jgi:DUF1680 family protein
MRLPFEKTGSKVSPPVSIHLIITALQRMMTDPVLVCCCPPNLSRTLGMLGGYTWTSRVEASEKVIRLDVYLFVSGSKVIDLSNGEKANVRMKTSMPWKGETEWEVEAPQGWNWVIRLPQPEYATDIKVSEIYSSLDPHPLDLFTGTQKKC